MLSWEWDWVEQECYKITNKSVMVSIIVPIYNTGKYLRDSVGSLLNQTYKDLEIILIDDGSDKETADICDSLSTLDDRIVVRHTENGGVSKARNLGIELANGEIIGFLDSDDQFTPNAVEKTVDTFRKFDVNLVVFDLLTIYSDSNKSEIDSIQCLKNSFMILSKQIRPTDLRELAGSACRCFYRKSILSDKTVFPIGIKFSEDRIFNLLTIRNAKTIYYLKEPLYRRLIRKGSACFRYYPDIVEQIEKVRSVMLDVVEKSWGKEYVQIYEDQISGHILGAVTNLTSADNKENVGTIKLNLRRLCESESIRSCLMNSSLVDKRKKLILNNSVSSLYFIGRLTNYYHKICHLGQYQG
ncbi:MAG: glycosyltransferase family 2 protein [Bacteroides sp.]|nr:glycosyltransferase family 2 protein [Bacteroides sp.]